MYYGGCKHRLKHEIMPPVNPRFIALNALKNVIIEHQSLDEALDLSRADDLNLIKFLSYGVLREYQSLEFLLNQLLNKPLKTKELELKLIMLLGLFQLKSSRIPNHAAINETVNLAKITGYEHASGLVNAILRRYSREQESLLTQLTEAKITDHPDWLLKKIKNTYPHDWQNIITANNTQAPMHLRINQRKTTPEAYLKMLAQHNLSASLHPEFPDAITLKAPIDIQLLPKFNEGWISVQDLAAQLAPYFLDLQAGQNILDACAAPGGKTCHILEHTKVKLTSMDIAKPRLKLIEENLTRLGLKANICLGDARLAQNFPTLFDRILIDAPCSGTGVIRRHPDIKFLRQEADIQKLHELQVKIIMQLANQLKPGGLLLYATCSILNDENDLTIKTALTQLTHFASLPLKLKNFKNTSVHQTEYGLQLLPDPSNSDGFYYALLKNKD